MFKLKKVDDAAPNVTPGYDVLKAVFEYVKTLVVPVGIALYPFPALSFHCVTFDPESVTVDGSPASNHATHPEMSIG
jgi:hypothetical protein